MNTHRVFVSHSDADEPKAGEIVSFLEAEGIEVWIPSRDATLGAGYSEQVEESIAACSAFLVIITEETSSSRQMRGETQMAYTLGKPLFPVRFSDVEAPSGLRLFLAVSQWVDLYGTGRERNLQRLGRALRTITGMPLLMERRPTPAPPSATTLEVAPKGPTKRSDQESLGESVFNNRRSRGLLDALSFISAVITIATVLWSLRDGLVATVVTVGPWMVLAAFLAALLAITVYQFHTLFFFTTDLIYTFPVIGKLPLLAKSRHRLKNDQGWQRAELVLCLDYSRHLWSLSKTEFVNCSRYLRKSLDAGRTPLPVWALVLVIFLVSLETLGIGYLIAPAVGIKGTGGQSALFLATIAVLASVLVWVMHAAGHELYRTNLLRSCFRMYYTDVIHASSSRLISLNEDQTTDDTEPVYFQCANRVMRRPGDLGSYTFIWYAATMMVLVAVGLTIFRIETLNLTQQEALTVAFPAYPSFGTSRASATIASFLLLAVTFVVTQLVALGLGFRYGFAGRESAEAYKMTRGHADFESYFQPFRRRMSTADLRLTTLHRLMEKRRSHEINWKKDFLDFIRQERSRGNTSLQDPTALDDPD